MFLVLVRIVLFLLCRVCLSWPFGVSKGIVLDKRTYHALNPNPSTIDASFLNCLSRSEVTPLSADISIIDLKQKVDLKGVSTNYVFVRRNYNELLRVIRESQCSVLIGNPGTSKSFFQFYYMARLMRPELYGDLPPDWLGSTSAPRIVIRQMGDTAMIVYDLQAQTADRIEGISSRVMTCFDPRSTLYLHEPLATVAEPLFYGHDVPTLSTVSPDLARYKEFVKGGAGQVYMPVYTIDELLTIARFLEVSDCVPKGVSYSEHSVKERFKRYGGIFRHVLPIGSEAVRSAAKSQEKAIYEADAGVLLRSGDIEQADVSHFLVHYQVSQKGQEKFRGYAIDLANSYIRDRLQDKFNSRTLEERRLALIRNDETGFMETECEKLFEGVLTDSLAGSGGVTWKKRTCQFPSTVGAKKQATVPVAAEEDWQSFFLSMRRVERVAAPLFTEMKEGVIYQPTEENFPAVDFIYKNNDTSLVGVKVTRMQSNDTKKVKVDVVLALLARLGLSAADASKLQLVLIPHPRMQNSARLSLVDSVRAESCNKEEENDTKKRKNKIQAKASSLGLKEYVVWGVPPDYGTTWAR